jgi:hypothetical protein
MVFMYASCCGVHTVSDRFNQTSVNILSQGLQTESLGTPPQSPAAFPWRSAPLVQVQLPVLLLLLPPAAQAMCRLVVMLPQRVAAVSCLAGGGEEVLLLHGALLATGHMQLHGAVLICKKLLRGISSVMQRCRRCCI